MAHHDALTGANNRRAFEEFMHNMPQTISDRDINVCFALFDVNHFKAVNDSYGHGVGDQVLKVIAARIGSVLRKGEELFRIGGDEFAVVLPDTDGAAARAVVDRLSSAFHAADIAFSLGAAVFVSPPQTVDSALSRVDSLMYAVKADRSKHTEVCIIGPVQEPSRA